MIKEISNRNGSDPVQKYNSEVLVLYFSILIYATSYFQFTTFGDKYFTFYSTILIT